MLHSDAQEDEAVCLLRELQAASASGGPESACELAESFLRRGAAVALLQRLRSGSRATWAVAAAKLLEAMHGLALGRLRDAGWHVAGPGAHAGALRFVHAVTGEEEEDPELPGKLRSWEARLLQSLALLAAPGECDVVYHRPCCGSGILLEKTGCDHRAQQTVIDIVADSEDGHGTSRLRQLHAGVFKGTQEGNHADWDRSRPPDSMVEPWKEVTAAGLALLLVAMEEGGSSTSSSEAAVLVVGVGAGALPSFLGLHADHIRVDVFEPANERVHIAQRYFALAATGAFEQKPRGKPGKASGACKSSRKNRNRVCRRWFGKSLHKGFYKLRAMRCFKELLAAQVLPKLLLKQPRSCQILTDLPLPGAGSSYAAVVVLGSSIATGEALDLPALAKLLTPRGALVLQAEGAVCARSLAGRLSSLWGSGKVTQLTELDLQEDPSDDSTAPQVLVAGPELPTLSTNQWHRYLQAPCAAFRPGVLDLAVAQRTRVIHVPNLLSDSEMAAVKDLARQGQRNEASVEVRSAPTSDAWKVCFLQADGLFESAAAELKEKLTSLARSIGDQQGWWEAAEATPESFNVRVAEYYSQAAPGPGLPDRRHFDMDSLVTVDILLSTPGVDFEGGEFSTLEPSGALLAHSFGRGDAVVFNSHKFHCVGPVTAGRRHVLVVEFWRGPSRRCPHRCRSLQPTCPAEPEVSSRPGLREAARGAALLPFRLASVEEDDEQEEALLGSTPRRLKLLWQVNDMDDDLPQPPTCE
ncbi:unnamed protein product [Polarella glacialis]|uniref:Fe2OG dioxygenase domain-containing protein n=1 Tax=Polarella glacialis TaxID=89957 RepID=A0A813LX86_POLGL|nr:unnamed protein product [Polarella glacialis]CAE8740354.1 unnamed protein product [Polarella glacialis]